ncbi:hypothetical protein HFP57_01010 [Parasphingopyxis algicola]|uniref:hypothetical protein n=1 Tax=Parasphingopyxis algicola TaxID=2026624 RepID=UPI0015A39013|nr:hypothetical protein [Parasphingopyxis algicola]QLC23751.1 hypothetical protein HFP57_01010 [Parasphingopyxis algicola]
MEHKEISRLTAQAKPVRVSLPAEVAYDFDKFQQVQKDILGRLGCLACCSGWDIRWDIFRDFRVDEKLNVQPGQFG